jgi:hypothetical protein
LRLTPHNYSPSVLRKAVRSSARQTSFQEAADALEEMAEVTISPRQLTRLAHEVGHQLETCRDQQVHQLRDRQLAATVATRPALAVVEVDGGRLRIRGEGDGPGAHDASWREDKISLLATAARKTFEVDPEPDLPPCFRDPKYVEKLAREIGGVGPLGTTEAPPEPGADAPRATTAELAEADAEEKRGLELLVRTYVASTCDSEAFGPMVAAEAQRRHFLAASRGAFVGDGAAWIWKLKRQHFPHFEAIVDFLHVLSYLFAGVKAAVAAPAQRWPLFLEWAEACWRGKVADVIEQLRGLQERLGTLPAEEAERLPADDPRQVLADTLVYLEHNAPRMDYPRYRREGLPITSSYMESTVKRFNRRVKGTEKSWGEAGAEAILQLRAAFLSEDGRLDHHQRTQPCSPFRTYKTRKATKVA